MRMAPLACCGARPRSLWAPPLGAPPVCAPSAAPPARRARLRGAIKRVARAATLRRSVWCAAAQRGSGCLLPWNLPWNTHDPPPAASGPSAGNAIYHDNGSAGFTDSSNVIDGTWSTYFFQDDSLGPYGPGAQCPGRDGAPADCGMAFINNYMRTNAGGTTQHVNTTYANNSKIAPGSPLPPAAAAIVAAAGPRY